MEINYDFKYLDQQFDNQLQSIDSLNWLPWVGEHYYSLNGNKLLILGESHYHWKSKSSAERLARKSFTREVVEFDDALNPKSKLNFYRNLERAIFLEKNPSTEAIKRLWRSVCFHNLVLRPMANNLERPVDKDYIDGWETLLKISEVLRPDFCIFAGTDWKKIDAFNEAVKNLGYNKKLNFTPVKMGRSKGRMYSVEGPTGNVFSIMFIKHPSAFFKWERWGKFINEHITAISVINQLSQNETL